MITSPASAGKANCYRQAKRLRAASGKAWVRLVLSTGGSIFPEKLLKKSIKVAQKMPKFFEMLLLFKPVAKSNSIIKKPL